MYFFDTPEGKVFILWVNSNQSLAEQTLRNTIYTKNITKKNMGCNPNILNYNDDLKINE